MKRFLKRAVADGENNCRNKRLMCMREIYKNQDKFQIRQYINVPLATSRLKSCHLHVAIL